MSPVFVGRQSESETLASLLRAADAGTPQAAVIGGEAGVGKTRLLEEFLAGAAGAGALTAVGAGVELGADGLPFAPVAALLRSLHRQVGDELVAAAGERRGELARLLPELGEPSGVPPVDGDALDRARLFELLTRLLERLAQQRTLVLVFEDLHWADRSTRELLAYYVRSVRAARLLVLASYRTDDLHRRHPLRPFLAELDRLRTVHRIELGRLSGREVAAQMAGILGAPADAGQARSVFQRTEGNPFFVEELTVGGQPCGDLPDTLRDLLLVRVEALDEPVQDVLRVVAEGGSCVEHELIARVAGLPEQELLAAVRVAVGARLLVATEDGDGYRFRHALTREAVADDLLPGERARLNRRYARALEAEPELVPADELPTRLASHWYHAGDRARALPAVLAAAVAAGRRFANAEQLRLLERAIELWDAVGDEARAGLRPAQPIWGYPASDAGGPVGWTDLMAEAAVAATLAGEEERAMALCRRALREVDPVERPLHAAWFWAQRAGMVGRLMRGDGWAELRRAQELLRGLPPSEVHARVLALEAAMRSKQGPAPEVLEVAERAVELARLVGATGTELYARYTLATLQADAGDSEGGVERMTAVLETVLRRGEVTLLGRCLVNLGAVLLDSGQFERGLEQIAESIELAERYGLAETPSWLRANEAFALTLLGRWPEAEAALELATRHASHDHSRMVSRVLTGQLAVLRGDLARAEAEAAAALARAEGMKTPDLFHWELSRFRVDLAVARGRPLQAREILRSSLPLVSYFGSSLLAWGLAFAAATAEAEGRGLPGFAEGREAAVGEIRALARRLPRDLPIREAFSALVNAQLARAEGRDTPERWAEAVAALTPFGLPHHLAEARYGWGEALLAGGDQDGRRQAAEQLGAARELVERLGAAPLAERVARLAQRARLDLTAEPGARPGPEPEARPFGLTRRERDVLELVAAGRSNRQIAEELYMSPKTASVHVSRILAKLEVTTRGEAAAVAHRLRLVTLS
ncbi:helix-turn-helix transcriptional regulator [Streptomyces triticirhizae]|uniref:helix-turn-helix transcriptional regulator n=1 Tax=Streptomyces triticirhizae TaxID=2483353 RepID=UPI001F36FE90|nr:helix-turn-helix transcriptional regulator [Streptomyces triticirhizae]